MNPHHRSLLLDNLVRYWGYNEFREHQLEVINRVMVERKDCFLMMATGSGKSLTFQLPAVTLSNLGSPCCSIVISPLIALMEDQVSSLQAMGIAACALGSMADRHVEEQAMSGAYCLIYCSPEKALMWRNGFAALSKVRKVVCIAIDESHCVSEWGPDFRPDYRNLGELRDIVGLDVPVVALTASATLEVQADILRNLRLVDPLIVRATLNRPNLHYSVRTKSTTTDVVRALVDYRRKQLISLGPAPAANPMALVPFATTLIYTNSRKGCEIIAQEIVQCSHLKGIRVAYYHASMPYADRSAVLQAFLRDEINVIVATTAFGMGINKPDIRLVIHYGLSLSVEAYYQQTGRAGRDGLQAHCVLLWSRSDITTCYSLASGSSAEGAGQAVQARIQAMVGYAQGEGHGGDECRRRYLLRYFQENEEDIGPCTGPCCDICEQAPSAALTAAAAPAGDLDLSHEVYQLLSTVQDCGGYYGLAVPIGVLLGKNDKTIQRVQGYERLEFFGKGCQHNADWWKALAVQLTEVDKLLEAALVKQHGMAFSYQRYSVSAAGQAYLNGARGQQPKTAEVTLDSLFDGFDPLVQPQAAPVSLWEFSPKPAPSSSSSSSRSDTHAYGNGQYKVGRNGNRLAFHRDLHTITLQIRGDFLRVLQAEDKVRQSRYTNDEAAKMAKEVLYANIEEEGNELKRRLVRGHTVSSAPSSSSSGAVAAVVDPRAAGKVALETALRTLRNDIAQRTRLNPYNVLTAQEMSSLLASPPGSVQELMGELRWMPWKKEIAEQVMALINMHCAPKRDDGVIDLVNVKEEPVSVSVRVPAVEESKGWLYKPAYEAPIAEGPGKEDEPPAIPYTAHMAYAPICAPKEEAEATTPVKAAKKRPLMGGIVGLKPRVKTM